MTGKTRKVTIFLLLIASFMLSFSSLLTLYVKRTRLSESAVLQMHRLVYPSGTRLVTFSWKNVGKTGYSISDHALLEKKIGGKWTAIVEENVGAMVVAPFPYVKPGDVVSFNFHYGTYPFDAENPGKQANYEPRFEDMWANQCARHTATTGIYRITAYYIVSHMEFDVEHFVTFPTYAYFLVF